MNVKELIAELQKVASRGEAWEEAEVVGRSGEAIYFINPMEGYWDGSYTKLKINEAKKPYYCIEGADKTRSGNKVRLELVDVWSLIWDHPEGDYTAESKPNEAFQKEIQKVNDWQKSYFETEIIREKENRLLVSFGNTNSYEKFKEFFSPVATKWRDIDKRCYQLFYDNVLIFVYYDLTPDMIDEARQLIHEFKEQENDIDSVVFKDWKSTTYWSKNE